MSVINGKCLPQAKIKENKINPNKIHFIGFLIEHFGGNFPLWLAPVQIIVLPISEKTEKYATEIYKQLIKLEIRAEINNKPDKIGAKIREAELLKINIMLIIGSKENENNTVTVRKRFEKDQKEMTLSQLSEILTLEINQRRRNLSQT